MKKSSRVAAVAAAGFMWLECSCACAQPLLHWNFDEASSGSQDAIDSGLSPSESGAFLGGATRTGNTPGNASVGAADLFAGVAGTNAYIKASRTDAIDALEAITISGWLNLQADPVGNDRIAALQASGTPLDADFDDNGIVDGSDLLTWQRFAGVEDGFALSEEGDANRDGNVLDDDFAAWELQYGGAPFPRGQFAGFSLNINAPNEGTYSANDFRLGMFLGGLNSQGTPAFEFGQSTVDIEGQGGQWIFFATTFDGATGELVIYTGSEALAPTQLGNAFLLSLSAIEGTGGTFYLGRTDAAPTANTSLEGFLDDFRIYGTALTPEELDAVRLENLPSGQAPSVVAAPEPVSATLACGGICGVALLDRGRRRRRRVYD